MSIWFRDIYGVVYFNKTLWWVRHLPEGLWRITPATYLKNAGVFFKLKLRNGCILYVPQLEVFPTRKDALHMVSMLRAEEQKEERMYGYVRSYYMRDPAVRKKSREQDLPNEGF